MVKSLELIVRLGQCMAHLIVKEWAFLNSSRSTGMNQIKPATIKSNRHHHRCPKTHHHHVLHLLLVHLPRVVLVVHLESPPQFVVRSPILIVAILRIKREPHLAPIRSIACKNSLKPRYPLLSSSNTLQLDLNFWTKSFFPPEHKIARHVALV